MDKNGNAAVAGGAETGIHHIGEYGPESIAESDGKKVIIAGFQLLPPEKNLFQAGFSPGQIQLVMDTGSAPENSKTQPFDQLKIQHSE